MTPKQKIQKKLNEMNEDGWRFKITPVNVSWWTERDGPASEFLNELLTIGPEDIHVEWYKEEWIPALALVVPIRREGA